MPEKSHQHYGFVLKGFQIATLTEVDISRHCGIDIRTDQIETRFVLPSLIELNNGLFYSKNSSLAFEDVSIVQEPESLTLFCDCSAPKDKLCEHQAAVLLAILKKEEYRLFFDEKRRHEKLRKFAADYGLEQEPDLDAYFKVEYLHRTLEISPRSTGLLAVTRQSMEAMQAVVLPETEPVTGNDNVVCIVFKEHKYYKYLFIELYSAQLSKEGKIKNPLTAIAPLDLIWKTEDSEQIRFFTGIHKFQQHVNKTVTETDITALKAIIKNPLGYDVYFHDATVSENITATSVFPVKVDLLRHEPKITVTPKDPFFEIAGTIEINNHIYPLKELSLSFTYFIRTNDGLHLVPDLQRLKIIELLTKKNENLFVHASKFRELQQQVLGKLEDKVNIDYKHIHPATPAQLAAEGFDRETERIIYLSDFGAHVMIIPVMRYGEVEVSIRTYKQIYSTDKRGKTFKVERDETAENDFMALLMKQHPYFEEQLTDDLHYFYLHKKYFLNEDWFPDVFEDWQRHEITVLGFNELENNKLNPFKFNINIKVLSGLNWFNVVVDGRFGKQKAALRQIYRAVKNKTKYVQLDDGTTGILPAEWLAKFTDYFNAGEIADDETLQIAKSNFTTVELLFDRAMLDEEVNNELTVYHQKLEHFDTVKDIGLPNGFHGELRPYQQQGLNWLNFLDDFNFGGCLADDMGLGKTVQVIAFILSQCAKVKHNVNLIVVPTSLIFNWQQEIARFAPSINVHTIYGPERIKSSEDFDRYEVVLTSYGNLISDIVFLRHYAFNYIFLDESQQIKNPESQRYKAARLLKSRNKIVLTGTPVENNTFDIYGQLSFACPGLLGSKTYFKQIYSQPIDMFKSGVRAMELQRRISPFILHRSKQEVATDLPEKTEMVLYCEMEPEQRAIYDAYEKEFRDYISATTGDELKKTPMNVLKGITRLRQICDSPLLLKDETMPGKASAKIDRLMEEIAGKMQQHKILVFSQFASMLDLIRKELNNKRIKHSYLTGQTRNRQAVVEAFQQDADIRVFLVSLKAGGTGLNLTEADYVYLVDPWWNPAVENQAIDRSHRIGQDKNIVAVRLICPDTVEEKIMTLQETKNTLVQQLIRPDSAFLNNLSKTDLLNLLT